MSASKKLTVSIEPKLYFTENIKENYAFKYSSFDYDDSKWSIYFYPYGMSRYQHKEKCIIELKADHNDKPSTWNDGFVCSTFNCSEINVADTVIHSINKSAMFVMTPSSEIKGKDKLIILIEVQLLRVFRSNNENQYFEKLNYRNPAIITHVFKNDVITKCRDPSSSFQVPKFQTRSNMWCLQYYKHYSLIEFKLILCALPPNISKLRICCKIECDHQEITDTASIIQIFDYTNYYATEMWCSTTKVSEEEMTITATINVLNVYDMNGKDITLLVNEQNDWLYNKLKKMNQSNDEKREQMEEKLIQCIESIPVKIESEWDNIDIINIKNNISELKTIITNNGCVDIDNKLQAVLNEMSSRINDLFKISQPKINEEHMKLKLDSFADGLSKLTAAIKSKASCSNIQEMMQFVSNEIQQKIKEQIIGFGKTADVQQQKINELQNGIKEIQKSKQTSTNIELIQDIKGRLETLTDTVEKYVEQNKTVQEIAKQDGLKASCSDIQQTLQSVSNGIKQKINNLTEIADVQQQRINELQNGIKEIQNKQTSISINIGLTQNVKGTLETLSDRFEKYVQQNKTVEEIAKKDGIKLWLEREVKLPQYYPNFIENGFENIDIICDITMDGLKLIGIDKVGHQFQILHHIKKYQNITRNNNCSTNIDNKSIANLLKQQHDDTIECLMGQSDIIKEKEKKNVLLQNALKDVTNCLLLESPEQYLPSFQQKCDELRKYVEGEHNGNKITLIDDEDKSYKARINEYIKLNDRNNRIQIMIINQKDKKSAIKQKDVVEIYKIKNHKRIPQLNGQYGLRAKQYITKTTVIGEYTGPYILNTDLEKLDGTRLYNKINAYAFEDNIDVQMSLNNVRYFSSSNEERKQMENDIDIDEDEDIDINQIQQPSLKKQRLNDGTSKKRNHNNNNNNNHNHNHNDSIDDLKVMQSFKVIIDGRSSNSKSMLCFMNDCRKYLELSRRTEDDDEYYNVKFITIQYNGWPRVFAVAIRDIKQNEELLSFYGANFIGVQKQSEKVKRRDDELKSILTSVGMKRNHQEYD